MGNNDEFEHEKDNQSLSSESASLSAGTDTNHTGEVSNDSSISIARAETKAVNRSKIIVLAVIAIAATACGAATYFFTKSEEEDDFHSQVRREWTLHSALIPFYSYPFTTDVRILFCTTTPTSSKTLQLKSLTFLILRPKISTAQSRVSLTQ
jgi:hypothetical protein